MFKTKHCILLGAFSIRTCRVHLYNFDPPFRNPGSAPDIPASDITNAELIKKPTVTTHTLLNTNCNKSPPLLDEIIDCTRYSKMDKLLCVTAYVLRFVEALKHRIKKGNPSTNNNNVQLTVKEINKAEQFWIQSLQVKSFLTSCNHVVTKFHP